MARMDIAKGPWPFWIYVKLGIFLLLVGGAHMIAKRVPNPARVGIPFMLALFAVAAYFAINKPM